MGKGSLKAAWVKGTRLNTSPLLKIGYRWLPTLIVQVKNLSFALPWWLPTAGHYEKFTCLYCVLVLIQFSEGQGYTSFLSNLKHHYIYTPLPQSILSYRQSYPCPFTSHWGVQEKDTFIGVSRSSMKCGCTGKGFFKLLCKYIAIFGDHWAICWGVICNCNVFVHWCILVIILQMCVFKWRL